MKNKQFALGFILFLVVFTIACYGYTDSDMPILFRFVQYIIAFASGAIMGNSFKN